jgi:hypothetical protein
MKDLHLDVDEDAIDRENPTQEKLVQEIVEQTKQKQHALRQALSPDGMYSLVGRQSSFGDQQIHKIDLDSAIETFEAKISAELEKPKEGSPERGLLQQQSDFETSHA